HLFAKFQRWGVPPRERNSNRLNAPDGDIAFGWPMLALWCDYEVKGRIVFYNDWVIDAFSDVHGGISVGKRRLPCRPIWSGLLVTTAVYTILWAPLLYLPAVLRAGFRRVRRARGLCPRCGYSLAGLAGEVCPECGTPAKSKPASAPGS